MAIQTLFDTCMPIHIYSLEMSVTAVKTDKQYAKRFKPQKRKNWNVISISQSHDRCSGIMPLPFLHKVTKQRVWQVKMVPMLLWLWSRTCCFYHYPANPWTSSSINCGARCLENTVLNSLWNMSKVEKANMPYWTWFKTFSESFGSMFHLQDIQFRNNVT